MYIKNILLVLLFVIGSVSSRIIESPTINVVHEHVKAQDTLVLFDLDETVFEVPGQYVNDFWFTQMVAHAHSLGHTGGEQFEAVTPHYFKRMGEAPPVVPVEAHTAEVIRSLQEKNIPVMGFTARSTEMISSTMQQLSSIGVDFSKTSIMPHNISFPLTKIAKLHDGVMFCSGLNPKGDALKALLNATTFKPKKIVFIDDKEKNLTTVMKAATDLGIEFIGIRYSGLDEKMKQFVLDEESKALLAPPAQKIIVEHDAVEAIKQYLVPNTVVLFDVDDTLFYMDSETGFGGNKWINQMMVQGEKVHGCTREELESWVAPMYFDAQHKVGYKAVQENTAAVIKELQGQGIPVMGLTARRMELVAVTNKWLKELDIDLSLTAPTQEVTSLAIDHPNIFVQGVLFCGGSREDGGKKVHAKDKAIKAFFKHLDLKPTRVIVVDDQKHYLEPIVNAIISLGIDCVGIRYSRSDMRMNSFVLDEGSKELLRTFAATKTVKNS